MTAVLNQQPYDGKSYSVAGIRMLLKEFDSDGKTPGYRYVGNMHSPSFDPSVDYLQHFSAASGAQLLDLEVPIKTSYKIGFTVDELLASNMKRFFFAADPTDVAADAVATAGPDLFLAGKTGEVHGLDEGRQTLAQRGDLAVYNVTDAALLVEDTDYEVITQFGLTFLRMLVDTHAGDVIRAGEGATAVTAYHFTKLAHQELLPMTNLRLECAVILQGVAKRGVNFEWRIDKALLKPDGEFDLNPEAISTMKFAVEALDNSVNEPTKPFGTFRRYGVNTGAII